MFKKGYYGNESLSFAWDLGVIFLGVRNLRFGGLETFFILDFRFKGATEKFESCFLVYFFKDIYFFKKVLRDEGVRFLHEPIRQ